MRATICSVLALFLTVACGKNGQINVAQLGAIKGIAQKVIPNTMNQAQKLNVNELPQLLTKLAQSGKLDPAQASIMLNPVNQQVLANLFQLLQGGAGQGQLAGLTKVLGTGSTGAGNLNDMLNKSLAVFVKISPWIAMVDPRLAAFVKVAVVVIPMVQKFINNMAPAPGGTAVAVIVPAVLRS